jgi:hypothetical protein
LRERYGVVAGENERGDKSDLKRFRPWLADAKWRIRKMKADEKYRALAGSSVGMPRRRDG